MYILKYTNLFKSFIITLGMVTKILSGMRPTGRLHIGHLVGALDNWVVLQNTYDSHFFVADWHAITTQTDTSNIKQDSFEMAREMQGKKQVCMIRLLIFLDCLRHL